MNDFEIRGKILKTRIKLEQTVEFLADSFGLDLFFQLKKDLDMLKSQQILDIELYNLARKILELGNRAAHKEFLKSSDALNAETFFDKFEKKLKERELKYTKHEKSSEPTFEELLGITKKEIKNESFSKMLDEFEGKNSVKKTEEKPQKKQKKEKITKEEFEKLLDDFDFDDFDKFD